MGRGVILRISASRSLAAPGSSNVSMTATPSSPTTNPALAPALPLSLPIAAHTPSPSFSSLKSGAGAFAAMAIPHSATAANTALSVFLITAKCYHVLCGAGAPPASSVVKLALVVPTSVAGVHSQAFHFCRLRGTMVRCILLFALLVAMTFEGLAQDRSYGRSMVITDRGIVATSQYLASQAGAQILARGGSAVDAAIAANAVLGVTEPMMNGMGGDLFLIYWDAKTGKLYGLNSSGWAPRKLTIDFLAQQGIASMPNDGIHTVTVPGAVEGWSKAHQRFGRLPWKELFTPAIYYAEHGYAVPELIHDFWVAEEPKMQKTEEARRVFLPGGKAPELGERFTNPDLAKALHMVAGQGRDAFYKGPIAKAIVQTSSAFGGSMQLDDLADSSAEWVEPISIDYRGWKIYELPPNVQGMAALEMLNIMSNFQPDKDGPQGTVELHKKIEAMKLAYADLYRYNADPKFAKVPVQGLLSKEYAAQRAALINPNKANCNPGAGSPATSDTVYLAAVDKDGNIASLIQSIYAGFGSGIVVSGMGFALQNRGALFVLDPSHPNALL